MSLYPYTLKFLETVASQRDREDAFARKTSGFGYYLLILPVLWLLPYVLVYEYFRMRQN
jgi:hypothetical protein